MIDQEPELVICEGCGVTNGHAVGCALDGVRNVAAMLSGRPATSIDERRRQLETEGELLRREQRRRLPPRPEDTVRPELQDLEGSIAAALRGELEPIRKGLRELAASLKDELLASRVREIVARVGDGGPDAIVPAWGEIQWIIQLEDDGRART